MQIESKLKYFVSSSSFRLCLVAKENRRERKWEERNEERKKIGKKKFIFLCLVGEKKGKKENMKNIIFFYLVREKSGQKEKLNY